MTASSAAHTIPDARRRDERNRSSYTDGPLAWLVAMVLQPAVLHRKSSVRTGERLTPLGIDVEQRLPAALRQYIDDAESALALAGFDTPFRALSSSTASVAPVVSLLEHPGHHALAFVMVTNAPYAGMNALLSLCTHFEDGTELWTTNARQVARVAGQPHRTSYRFADVENLRALYDVHRFLVEERSRTTPVKTVTRGKNPIAYQTREAEATFEFWIRRGYYYRANETTLRLTWKGAVLSAWRGLFPWVNLSIARDRRRAEAVLARYRASRGARAQL